MGNAINDKSSLFMSKELEGKLPEVEQQQELINKLIHVLFNVVADDEFHTFLGSLIGIEIANTVNGKQLKIDMKTTKEDALMFMYLFTVSDTFKIDSLIVSSEDIVSLQLIDCVVNVIRVIDVDVNTGMATLAADVVVP